MTFDETPWPFTSPRRRPAPAREAWDSPPPWAARGREITLSGGRTVEAHPVGSLAAALGKSAHTIRRWEREGVIPKAFLLRNIRGGPSRRLYTREQVVGMLCIAQEEGVAFAKPTRAALERFALRVRDMQRQLYPNAPI